VGESPSFERFSSAPCLLHLRLHLPGRAPRIDNLMKLVDRTGYESGPVSGFGFRVPGVTNRAGDESPQEPEVPLDSLLHILPHHESPGVGSRVQCKAFSVKHSV